MCFLLRKLKRKVAGSRSKPVEVSPGLWLPYPDASENACMQEGNYTQCPKCKAPKPWIEEGPFTNIRCHYCKKEFNLTPFGLEEQ